MMIRAVLLQEDEDGGEQRVDWIRRGCRSGSCVLKGTVSHQMEPA